jgi:hypothetical protein
MLKRRQPPDVEVATTEATILQRSYDLIEHMQQLKGSSDQQQILHCVRLIESDLSMLNETLRGVKANMKDIKQKQSVSDQADVAQKPEPQVAEPSSSTLPETDFQT